MPKCTYCNADVSDTAKQCPRCGDNLDGMRQIQREKFKVMLVKIFSFPLGIAGLILGISLGDPMAAIGGVILMVIGVIAYFTSI